MEVIAQELTKRFNHQTVVDKVSFSVKEGQTLVLLGTSGSGKTTCLRMINRLVHPDGGRVLIDGKDPSKLNPVELRRNIGYVIQQAGLFPHLTVAQNIEIVPQLKGWDKAKRQDRARELLSLLGLSSSLSDRLPKALSGGQQQRIGIARALAADPGLVLLDEPFGALDPITRRNIQNEFLRLPALKEKTLIMVTHDVQEAFRLGDQIALLDEGKLQQLGTPKELLFSPANPFVKSFFDPQRLSLQLSTVTLADLISHAHSGVEGTIHFQNMDNVEDVLTTLAANTEQKDVSFEGGKFNSAEDLMTAYYRTVEAWTS